MKLSQCILYLIIPVTASIVIWVLLLKDPPPFTCHHDYDTGQVSCRAECDKGSFSLAGMEECQPLLTCYQMRSDVKSIKHITAGAVKMVYQAEWRGHLIVLNALQTPKYKKDFQHGLAMLINLQPHREVTQLLGYCNDQFITEYHKHGTVSDLLNLLEDERYMALNLLEFRFGLCIKYAEVIRFLHNSPLGTRVMCDSNDLPKTLSQFLVTSDLRFVVNDLDALPKVNRSAGILAKCGHRELRGAFVAPEQLWPFEDLPFRDEQMPGYDEKTDIWKIPNVCDHLLGSVDGADTLRFHLFKIHQECKRIDPELRPTAEKILESYRQTQYELGLT